MALRVCDRFRIRDQIQSIRSKYSFQFLNNSNMMMMKSEFDCVFREIDINIDYKLNMKEHTIEFDPATEQTRQLMKSILLVDDDAVRDERNEKIDDIIK